MRSYETAFLIAPTLPEEETEKLIEKMAAIVSKKKGKLIHVDKWGKKKLAYPIEKHNDAFYVFLEYKGDPAIPAELERNFKQTEAVIRYLTVKMEERANIRRKKKKPRGKRPVEFGESASTEEAPAEAENKKTTIKDQKEEGPEEATEEATEEAEMEEKNG